MDDFVSWLNSPRTEHPARYAADVHLRFVTIHPFVDGNGRLGRILMNLELLSCGYPPALIRNEDREEYISSLERAQLSGDDSSYYSVIYSAIERSLDIYLSALQSASEVGTESACALEKAIGEVPVEASRTRVLKIGELAREVGESVPTIRYWTSEGLLAAASKTSGGYALYDPAMADRAREIRRLQRQERLTIAEIRDVLGVTAD